MNTLQKIAKRNVEKISQTKSQFEMLQQFTKMYDMIAKGGNDELLVIYMMNEIGYEKPASGCGWIKK